VDLKQPSELGAELEQLEREQRSRQQIETAGAAINELSEKLEKLLLIVHKAGTELNVCEGSGSPPRYTAGTSLAMPEFRVQGNTYTLLQSAPVDLSQYRAAPSLSELVEGELDSPERQQVSQLELQRVVLCAQLAQAEQSLHRALTTGDTRQLPSLDEAVRTGKSRLEQLTSQLSELKS